MTTDFEKQLEKKAVRWAKVVLPFNFLVGYITLNGVKASPELMYALGFIIALMGVRATFDVMKILAEEAVKDDPG